MNPTRWTVLTGGLLLGGRSLAFARAGAAQDPPRPGLSDRDPSAVILPRRGEMRVSLEVLVDGRLLPTVRHAGRTYMPVPRGAEYEIRVGNHGPRRIAAIVSVDGLSVLTSRPASESDPGYIVDPDGSIRIKGWRRGRDTVAAFRFVGREESYASRLGHPENVGVIGLIAVEELSYRPRPLLEEKGMSAPPAGQAHIVGDTGTGYGRDLDSPVYYVPFVRSANRRAVTLYYDTPEGLRRAGVPVDDPLPVPFPGDR